MIATKPTLKQRALWKVHAVLHWLLEDRYTSGLGGPPNMHRQTKDIPGRDATYRGAFNNDAHEFWIEHEYPGEQARWAFSCPSGVFRRLALYYLWRWAWGEWFGLRRRLYYIYLHWEVRRVLDGNKQREVG